MRPQDLSSLLNLPFRIRCRSGPLSQPIRVNSSREYLNDYPRNGCVPEFNRVRANTVGERSRLIAPLRMAPFMDKPLAQVCRSSGVARSVNAS
jgi:hypothetical protein